MTIQTVLFTAIVLFAIAAGGGLLMAGVRVFGDRNPPAWLAMLHGLLAGAGLTLLLFATFTIGLPKLALWALGLLIIAALGGVFMNLGFQEQRKPLPKSVMYLHALIAASGFVLLIIASL